MKKFLYTFMVLLFSMSLVSCGDVDDDVDDETIVDEEDNDDFINYTTGVYKIEVTQSGDLDKFYISSTVGDADEGYWGLYDTSDNKSVGIYYDLTDEEARRPNYAYTTKATGVSVMASISYVLLDSEEPGSISCTITVYKDGRMLVTETCSTTDEVFFQVNSAIYEYNIQSPEF